MTHADARESVGIASTFTTLSKNNQNTTHVLTWNKVTTEPSTWNKHKMLKIFPNILL